MNNDFRREYREARSVGWGVMPWIIVGTVVVATTAVIWSVLSTAATVASAPARVIERTLETGNIISNYEWYHDANGMYKSRVAQIKSKKGDIADPSNDAQEKYRLRIELSAMQQSCRDLANKYNANAIKTNRSIFMGREAPTELNPSNCE